MTIDRNGNLMSLGDSVEVPAPVDNDIHETGFTGEIIEVYDNEGWICVEDTYGHCFDFNADKVTLKGRP
jgi:hypothetical protein